MPTALANYIASAYLNSALSQTITDAEQSALYGILLQDQEVIPGGLTLYDIQALDPEVFPGAAELQSLYTKDPYSTDYENETQALYSRSFAVARAAAQSGPTNVRGGTARMAFELADLDTQLSINRFREIWQNQLAVAQVVINAAQLANAVQAQIRDMQLRAQHQQAGTEQGRAMQKLAAAEQLGRDRDGHVRTLAAGAEFLGVPIMRSEEALQGQGFQGGLTTSFGMSYWK